MHSHGMSDKFTTLRQRLGWSQTEAAEHFGVHQSTVSRWEAGAARIPPLVMREIERLAGDFADDAGGEAA